jgi:ribosomal protein L37E
MLILNEKKYAQDIYDEKNKDIKSVLSKIGYITRHLLYSLNQNDEENYKNTVEWLKKHHNNFDEIYYSNLISDAIKKAYKKPFYHIENIKITKSELDIISSLDNLRAEKILFVLLCMAKQQAISNGFINGLVKYSITDLCKTARISVPADEREYILYNIIQKGFLDYPKKNNTQCLIVNFIDNDGEAVLNLNEADCYELAYLYLSWKNNGKGYTKCQRCGKMIKQSKTKPKKYCEECAQEVLTEQKRVWAEKNRKNLTPQND